MKISEEEFKKRFDFDISEGDASLDYDGSLTQFAQDFGVSRPRSREEMRKRLNSMMADSPLIQFQLQSHALRFWPIGDKGSAKIVPIDISLFEKSDEYRSIIFELAICKFEN
ncbi:TPA: hypothetical protein NID03_003066 [Pseudomonas aeruginosa]|nr:hypothetical protein [Pseudomonas aeruginosa]